MLTGSGVDEAWTTGTQLGDAVLELLRAGLPFTQQNLAATYEETPPRKLGRARRTRSRKRPQRIPRRRRKRHDRHGPRRTHPRPLSQLQGRTFHPAHPSGFAPSDAALRPRQTVATQRSRGPRPIGEGRPLHDALLSVRGWPEIPFDGRLLVTQQDALLIGGKVQAMPGFADHVVFRDQHYASPASKKPA